MFFSNKQQFKAPSLEYISESPYYKILLGHASQLEATVNDKTEHINRLLEEITQLQVIRTDMEESSTVGFEEFTRIV